MPTIEQFPEHFYVPESPTSPPEQDENSHRSINWTKPAIIAATAAAVSIALELSGNPRETLGGAIAAAVIAAFALNSDNRSSDYE